VTDFRYRRYIYLDSDEILNVAAIIEGGEVSEELRNLTRGFGGKYGGRRQMLAETSDSDGNALSGRGLPDKAARVRTLIMASRLGCAVSKPTGQESLRRR
jgi:hypothetical protein